ncbi:hypothetical protein C8J56DRAFT_477030 [Mycena floridula]|nr:hypothetical protein C8J56DRAFT_477030 [Mycena floridula]
MPDQDEATECCHTDLHTAYDDWLLKAETLKASHWEPRRPRCYSRCWQQYRPVTGQMETIGIKPAIQYVRVRGLRVIAIDTGVEKEKLCKQLGAEVWTDFRECKVVLDAIRSATGGLGARAAVLTAASSIGYKLLIICARVEPSWLRAYPFRS